MARAKDIELEQNVPEDLIIFSDKNLLDTILRNLLSNAIKFTPSGGKVKVTCQYLASDNFVTVEVCDTGIGMDEKKINNLFQIDQNISTLGTAKEKGTGLGLILCKEFVELQGGKIWIESKKGKGTQIFFTLPMHA